MYFGAAAASCGRYATGSLFAHTYAMGEQARP
jgi:hypothetical protein